MQERPGSAPDAGRSDPLSSVLARFSIPRWARMRLTHPADRLHSVEAAVREQFQRPAIGEHILPGARVAVLAGSRGIDRIADVTAATVAEVIRRGGSPFIVPAMGSHGGATVAGQLALLAHYGVTEAQMGCPIRASMETVELGRLPTGELIYTDRSAASEADLIIPINRVKPHTSFHGPVESGLLKMLCIGLGKQRGADDIHSHGFEHFPRLVPAAGVFVLQRLPVPFGIALVENGYGQLALLEAVPAAAIPSREPELLQEARARMMRLPIQQLDVLVVDQIGKEISGTGMDPNVIGRYFEERLPGGPDVQRIVVLDLTAATEGNAAGIGMAEFCTVRVEARLDRTRTYINQLTSKSPQGSRLPMVARSDREALQMAIASLRGARHDALRLMRIRNTKDLSEAWASEALLPELMASGRAEILDQPAAPVFDADGNLVL